MSGIAPTHLRASEDRMFKNGGMMVIGRWGRGENSLCRFHIFADVMLDCENLILFALFKMQRNGGHVCRCYVIQVLNSFPNDL